MKFVWEITEEDWEKYPEELKKAAEEDAQYYGDGNIDEGDVNTAGVFGCCRVGNLVFDLRAWGQYHDYGIGYELYVGGVDTGYNTTLNGYPYDLVEDYGEFPAEVLKMGLKNFEKMAEPVFGNFIKEQAKKYKYADLIEKANEDTNYTL